MRQLVCLHLAQLSLHPSTPLAVTPSTLEITRGESETATISGGVAPYTAESDKVTIVPTVDGTTITVAADANAAASATVTITDSGEDEEAQEVELAITTVEP